MGTVLGYQTGRAAGFTLSSHHTNPGRLRPPSWLRTIPFASWIRQPKWKRDDDFDMPHGRRAASEMPSFSRRAGSVASRVDDDIDAMRSSSRRQDSALLNDITARMPRGAACASPITTRRVVHHATTPTTTQYTVRASSLPPLHRRAFHEDIHLPEYRTSSTFYRSARPHYDLDLDDYYGLEDEIGAPTRPYVVPTRTVISASHGFHTGNVTGRPPLPHARTRKYLEEEEVESYAPPSYKNLRSRAADCRSKLDQQRTMLDRYLPTPTGIPVPVECEVQAKYGELAARLPYLEEQPRLRDRSMRSYSQPPPSRPAARPTHSKTSYDSLMRRTPSCRPPISDVRRHAREVLCKTKNDPTYFNY